MRADAADKALMGLRRAAAEAPLSIFVDPTLRDPTRHHTELADALHDCVDKGTARRISLPRIHDDFDPERHPFLIHAQSDLAAELLVSAALRVAMAEAFDEDSPEFTGRTICGWIIDDKSPEQRARQLASAAMLLKPDGHRHYLRFWDPRVLWHLPRKLASRHWAKLQSALGAWMYFDPLRQFVLFSPAVSDDGASPASPVGEADTTTRPIDSPTWQSLERIGPINQVLAMSWDWNLMPSHALAEQIDQLIVRSIERGFDSEQDMLVFATCGLTSHPRFDFHPEVHEALTQGAAKGDSLQHALNRFDDTFWSELAATQWARPTATA